MEAYKERMVKEYWELHERAVIEGIDLGKFDKRETK